jgi:hypothetical protein
VNAPSLRRPGEAPTQQPGPSGQAPVLQGPPPPTDPTTPAPHYST